jgi:PAS domain S-box-containing protein
MLTARLPPIAACLSLTRAISRASSDEDIYTASLDALAQMLDTSKAAILLFDADGVMRFKAWRNLSTAYRTTVEGHSPWAPDSPNPQTIVVSDVRTDSSLDGYQSAFAGERIGALAFIPLVSKSRVIGKFMLYYDEPRVLDEDERQLAEMIAAQVAFALARSKAETRLRLSDERLRFALEAAATGAWEMDLHSRTVTWSDGLYRLHGYETGSFDSGFDSYEQIIVVEDRERVRASINWAIEGARPYDIEYRVIGPDGVVQWVESKGRVEYEDGRAVRMTGICTAVTRRKQAELARLADAQEANQLKDQFLATLSHELRTPLNAILGWIQVLEHDISSPARVRHAADIVRRNAKLQAQLIEDILDVSRIMTGKLTIETQPLNVATLVDSALSGLLPSAALRQIQVSCDIPSTLATIDGDPRRLQQVLGNVISNAIKFTPEGGEVHLACEVSDRTLSLTVRDSGCGIAPELLPFVFDRFRQGDSGSTRQHGGLGLGLAIARHLIERHGGSIEAHSEGIGLGTTFVIRLPVLDNQAPVESGRAAAGPVTADLSGRKVLVVDDQEDSRELLVRLLHQYGASVRQCPSADSAFEALSSARFDLLVADIAMPDVDGYELIERVRHLRDSGRGIPAIAVTAYARNEDRDRALAAGYDGYCPKPLDAALFMSVIAELFKEQERPHAAL